jgi:hypothetical protein
MGGGSFGTAGCKPYMEIFQVKGIHNDLLYSNRTNTSQFRFYYKSEGEIVLEVPGNLKLYGNIMIQFKNASFSGTSYLFRLTFNTSFINKENILSCDRWQISPESYHKDFGKFENNFRVDLNFEHYC